MRLRPGGDKKGTKRVPQIARRALFRRLVVCAPRKKAMERSCRTFSASGFPRLRAMRSAPDLAAAANREPYHDTAKANHVAHSGETRGAGD